MISVVAAYSLFGACMAALAAILMALTSSHAAAMVMFLNSPGMLAIPAALGGVGGAAYSIAQILK